MIRTISNRPWLAYGVPALILLGSLLLGLSDLAVRHPELFAGITYDLILTAPLALVLLSWKRGVPKFAVTACMGLGALIAWYVVPPGERFHFDLLTSVLIPVVEMGVFVSIVFYAYRGVRAIRAKNKDGRLDYLALIRASTEKAFASRVVSAIFASEAAMLYYALFAWRRRIPDANEFSHHVKSGTIALFYALIFLILVETFAVHLLLARWSLVAAWVLSALSLYSGIMLFGHVGAIRRRPHAVLADHLELKNGLLGTVRIDYGNILEIVPAPRVLGEDDSDHFRLTMLGAMEPCNGLIRLKNAVEPDLMYGISARSNSILFQVDDFRKFKSLVQSKKPL